MDARAVIAMLRQGQVPKHDALEWFAHVLADQTVSDAQAGAFAMGICRQPLGAQGRTALTCAMRDSGRVLSWDVPGPVIDKHSTGGIGDCVSLALAPALAACGAFVPMISGRGLGHTGGTLDKMEAIPGVSTSFDITRFKDIVTRTGAAIVSATADIAPADRRLYRIRDVTATVESLDLITASILSKKLAAGLHGLVLDVKCGSGAFMKTPSEARDLAKALVETANAAGCPTEALITDMDAPLVPALGNALEVAEIMQLLTGTKRGRLFDLCCALGGGLLARSGLALDKADGEKKLQHAITTGVAAERFGEMVYAQGGPRDFVAQWPRFLPEAPVIREVPAPVSGHLSALNGEILGLTVVGLGGGRQVETDQIDPAVGLSDILPLGSKVRAGDTLARVHASREIQADIAVQSVQSALTIGPDIYVKKPLVLGQIS
jgi:thymidine phosphorylase